MNVPFRVRGADRAVEARFIAEAAAAGMVHLFGHPVRGGIRATTYVGLPDAAIDALVDFMTRFRQENP
jgi:phosphoserine aminotransferase